MTVNAIDRDQLTTQQRSRPNVSVEHKASWKDRSIASYWGKRRGIEEKSPGQSAVLSSGNTDRRSKQGDHDEPSKLTDSDFYLSLPSLGEFRDVCDVRHYHSLPGDWVVIVTDVVGSTKLVSAGRYRDVNTVGAMSIVAVRNVIGDNHPFAFGGDGATMVVRPEQKERAVTALLALQRLVQMNYDIHLRVGCVDVSRLEQLGASVKVARYEIAEGTSMAVFSGKGLSLAEEIVKGGEEVQQTPASQRTVPNLTGLSCRWNKVPSSSGHILTMLVEAYPGLTEKQEGQVYDEVLDALADLIPLQDSNPSNMELARYKKPHEIIQEEKRMHERRTGNPSWIKRAAEIRLCHVLFGQRRFQKSVIDVPAYMQSMQERTDYQKFDGMIRMVMDCTEEQVKQVEQKLQEFHRQEKVCFGLHQSKHALLTCLVEGANNGKHVHFVDGDSGGYTMAAKQLKKQLQTAQLALH